MARLGRRASVAAAGFGAWLVKSMVGQDASAWLMAGAIVAAYGVSLAFTAIAAPKFRPRLT
jgi:hypothetical protein